MPYPTVGLLGVCQVVGGPTSHAKVRPRLLSAVAAGGVKRTTAPLDSALVEVIALPRTPIGNVPCRLLVDVPVLQALRPRVL